MNVCLDIQSALAQRAGVGRYTRMLAEHLAAGRGDDQLALFYFDFKRVGCDFAPAGATQKAVRWIPGRYVQQAWKRLQAPPFNWFSGPADVYHFPNFIRPPLRRGKSVTTIHDAAFLRYPETLETKNYRYLTNHIRRTTERSDAIICVSAFTARELQELMGVPADRLHVIHSGLDKNNRRASPEAIASMRKNRKLERPYLLSVGTLEPRKNYPFLIDVFDRMDFAGDLVIVGMNGWKCDPIHQRRDASTRRDRIHFLRFVPDNELAALYSGAELFVTPSLYEGFGFPPLEAMQCGTPVVAAATGSLPEVLGDAALTIQGFDPENWKSAIESLLSDETRKRAFSAEGARRAASYTWDHTARQTWQLYRSLA